MTLCESSVTLGRATGSGYHWCMRASRFVSDSQGRLYGFVAVGLPEVMRVTPPVRERPVRRRRGRVRGT